MTTDERLERVEGEIGCVDEAIEFLREVRGMEDVIDMLRERLDGLRTEEAQIEDEMAAEGQRDREALRREYERGLM